MAQRDKNDIGANLSGTAFRSAVNSALSALDTQNAGATEPPNTHAGMLWLDTSNSSKHYLKLRNEANTSWGVICEITPSDGAIKNGYSTVEIDALLDSKINKAELEVSNAINKGVRRDSHGFIWTGYINSNMGEDSSLANATSSLIFRNSDGFLRQMSQAKLREVLNVYTKTEVNNLALNAAKTDAQNTFTAAQIFNGELSGAAFSSTSAANKVVKRDNNGDFKARHITAAHFNQITAMQDGLATPLSEVVYRNSDNYFRTMSLVKLKELLGVKGLDGLQARTGSWQGQANSGGWFPIRLNYAPAFPAKTLMVFYEITRVGWGGGWTSGVKWVFGDAAGFNTGVNVDYENAGARYQVNYIALGY